MSKLNKYLILIAIFSLSLKPAFSEYVRTFLPSLIENSKIIVHGRIIFVGKETFKIVALKTIKSKTKCDTLVIQKFKDWSSASRYSTYEIGQEAIFFIESRKGKFHVMGKGNEGELVVRSDTAYYSQDYSNFELVYGKIFQTKRIRFLSERNYMFYVFKLQTVIDGIELYRENIKLINNQVKIIYRDTINHQSDYIEKLPQNDFMVIIIGQRRNGHRAGSEK
jgi:hypothetical protein